MPYPEADRRRELLSCRADDPDDSQRGDTFYYLLACNAAKCDLLKLVCEDLERRAGSAYAKENDAIASSLRNLLRVWRERLENEEAERALFRRLSSTCHTNEHWSDECPGDHGK